MMMMCSSSCCLIVAAWLCVMVVTECVSDSREIEELRKDLKVEYTPLGSDAIAVDRDFVYTTLEKEIGESVILRGLIKQMILKQKCGGREGLVHLHPLHGLYYPGLLFGFELGCGPEPPEVVGRGGWRQSVKEKAKKSSDMVKKVLRDARTLVTTIDEEVLGSQTWEEQDKILAALCEEYLKLFRVI